MSTLKNLSTKIITGPLTNGKFSAFIDIPFDVNEICLKSISFNCEQLITSTITTDLIYLLKSDLLQENDNMHHFTIGKYYDDANMGYNHYFNHHSEPDVSFRIAQKRISGNFNFSIVNYLNNICANGWNYSAIAITLEFRQHRLPPQ